MARPRYFTVTGQHHSAHAGGDGSATDLLNEVRYELEYDQLDD
jgi:hypothetical protein